MIALAVIGAAVAIPAAVAVSALWRGWILTLLWGWFIVPTFHLPQLGLVPAIGLALVVGFFTYQDLDVEHPERSTAATWARMLAVIFLVPATSLLGGWIVHQFMPLA